MQAQNLKETLLKKYQLATVKPTLFNTRDYKSLFLATKIQQGQLLAGLIEGDGCGAQQKKDRISIAFDPRDYYVMENLIFCFGKKKK